MDDCPDEIPARRPMPVHLRQKRRFSCAQGDGKSGQTRFTLSDQTMEFHMVSIMRRAVLGAVVIAAGGYGGWRLYTRLTTRQPDRADLAYGTGERQVLDIYLPEGTGPFPFVIDIHGGAFRMGSKSMAAVPEAVLAAGIAVVRPNYRLSGTDLWPAQGEDCLAAAQFVLQNAGTYGLDPARFAIWGQSAGGFLAVSTALSLVAAGTAPSAVVDFYGPMDFSAMDADMAALDRTPAMGETNAAESAESVLLGYAVGDDPAAAKAMGPIGRLEAMVPGTALPPLFIRHGDADAMIAHGQSERLRDAWTLVDPAAPVDFALVPGAGHGTSEFNAAGVMDPLVAFLQAHLAV
jgi:acetyl esterase/lipase